jgi:hypothetical protein
LSRLNLEVKELCDTIKRKLAENEQKTDCVLALLKKMQEDKEQGKGVDTVVGFRGPL